VTLNSLIAATLLFEQSDVMKISDLLETTRIIYSYVKTKRNTMTYMQVKPQQMLVEKHLEGLGMKMQNKGKKTCQILINHKAQYQYLSLAHYSLRLSSVFVFEMGFAFLIDSHFNNTKNGPMKIDELYRKGMEWLNIFKYEHIFDDNLAD